MDSNLILPLLLLLAILILSFSSTFTSQAFPIAKPDCEDRCGNVSIPFPFGTKQGCYLNEKFFINCTNSSNNALRPFLRNSAIDVADIFLEEGQMRLLQFVGHDCYLRNESSSYKNSPWMKIGKPFIFNNTANKFTAVGCDTYSIVKGFTVENRTYTTGCMSLCNKKEDLVEGSCSGIGCCQTSIARLTRNFTVKLSSYYNHNGVWDFNPCSYAFLVEDAAFRFSADNLTNLDNVTKLPVIVDWTIDYATCEVAQKNSTSYACTTNSLCYEPANGIGYRCKCKDGYKGNPYLSDGCQDINECLDPTLNNCPKHSVCNNTLGSYTCDCSKGYYNYGGDDEEDCIPRQNHYGKLIWSVTGVAVSTALILAVSFCCYCEWKRRKEDGLKEDFFRRNGGLTLQQRLTRQGDGTNIARIFTVEELRKATNNFEESKIVGQGGFGTVFKGILADKTIVAIKKSKGVDLRQVEQFINEVILLSQINNRNVVKLLGCCLETEVPLLVYEFINNGTLSDHLHKFRASNLSWSIRLRIASEVAGVLSYLHSTASPPIIHRDIKSLNILLDHNYTAKVSDFGISKLVPSDEHQVFTVVQGTHGYLDPEYLHSGMLTEKSDVYSFGVVLVELLTGKKAFSSDRPEADRFLSNHFISSIKEQNLVQILDSKIVYNESIKQMKKVAMIAKGCLSVKGEDRPFMKEVARELEGLETRAKQFPLHIVELDSTEGEPLVSLQSEVHLNGDYSSCLYICGDSTREHMMLPTAGGR